LSSFSFQVTHSHNGARAGLLESPHGTVETPAFIFCATKGAIKGLMPSQMIQEGTQFVLSNTYHLMLSPGAEHIEKMGGLHKFMGWNGPLLTDSGGFQIFSLGHGSVAAEIKGKRNSNRPKTLLKITEDGAEFRSYLNGDKYFLTPERSVDVQRRLGVDFIVMLDECTPFNVDKAYTAESMRMSHRWGLRSLKEFHLKDNGTQKMYGIVQGGIYSDLRVESCKFINDHDFFGIAVGGSLGQTKEQMHEVVGISMDMLTKDRPVHLLGIGGISDIFNGVAYGIDTFDCVHPTRLARHGGALVKKKYNVNSTKEHLNLNNATYKEDENALEPDCNCSTCTTFSRAYIHYLLKAKELLAMQLLTIHNVSFMNRLMLAIRNAIKDKNLELVKKEWLNE
jgi:queuine tRNA-ribosyltransferase